MADQELINFEDYFQVSAYCLKAMGLNLNFECKIGTSNVRKCISFFHFHIVFWALFVTTALEILFFLSIMGDTSQLLDFCRCLSCALFDVMAIELIFRVWRSGYQFNEFKLQLEELFPLDQATQERYAIKKQAANTIQMLKNLAKIFISTIIIWVAGTPTADILYCYFKKIPYVFELPFKMWAPVDLSEPLYFYIALFMQVDTIYASVMATLAINTYFVSIVAQICLQFDMLAQNLRDLPPNDNQQLYGLIKMHVKLIGISHHFARLLSRSVFVNHILSSVAVCCALFQIITSDSSEVIRFIIYIACVLIQTFNMSFIGEILIEHSLKIPTAVYESKWIDCSPKMRLTLLQILHRSQKPLVVTGLGFFTISLPSFTKILTTSFSYFAVLKSMMD